MDIMKSTDINGLSVREYARARGMSLQMVYRQLWEGKLQATQILGRWVITSPAEPREEQVAANG